MNMQLIALTGKAGSGKDTVGLELMVRYGYHLYSFATPIRQALEAAFHLTDWHFKEGKELPIYPYGKSPRQMMQLLGTEFGRQLIHPDCWLMLADSYITRNNLNKVVITDCRFDNEAEWVRSKGGMVVQIIRPRILEVAAHSSEAGLSPHLIDHVIYNDGTLDDLNNKIDNLMQQI